MTERTSGLLVHEWIAKTGGAENVLDQFAIVFQEAPIACLWNDAPGRYPGRPVLESPLSRSPLRGKKAASAPLHPIVWNGSWHDRQKADWMLISSHSFAHQIAASQPGRNAETFAYVHTPARFIWAPEHDPRGRHPAAQALGPALRALDRKRAQAIDHIAVNSEFVRRRVMTAWGRDATVIYPPVAIDQLLSVNDWRTAVTAESEQRMLEQLPDQFILGASRLVEYKRLCTVIDAGVAAGLPVVIAGSGPDAPRLRDRAARAAVPVTFAGRVSDQMLRALMQLAMVYVFPPVEDFGIMPVEAMALGTPVVVNAVGGARESLEILRLGAVAESLEPSDIDSAIRAAMNCAVPEDRLLASKTFGERRFREEISDFVHGQ